MRFLYVVAMVLMGPNLFAQKGSITGKVTDSETNEALPFANIFIDNTTIGTAADSKGVYVLRSVPAGSVDVVFSFVGYQTYQTRAQVVPGQELTLNIKLIPDPKMLDNVRVEGKQDKEWEANLKRFTKVFLGTDKIASQSRILNPWVLEFKKDGETLLASVSEPIVIENDALGYIVTHFLSRFTARSVDYVIQGKVKFEEMKTFDPRLAEQWDRNRLEVYRGSTRHFFRSILAKKTRESGFRIYSERLGYETKPKTSVFQHELGNTLENYDTTLITVTPESKSRLVRVAFKKPKLEVHYLKTSTILKTYDDLINPVSWLELKSGTVRIDSSGNVYENLIVSGYMALMRVGNLLPNDYEPGKSGSLIHEIDVQKPGDLNDLRETVYINTDRSYYYRGDVIWFAGQMQYSNSSARDTLSRVLYVELIDNEKKILQSRTCFVDKGRVAGQFPLADSLRPGNYYIRAYTNWMRNFSDQFFFVKPIRVLSLYEKVTGPVTPDLQNSSEFHDVMMQTDKDVYKTREKITVTVRVEQDDYYPVSSVFSISVVDANVNHPISQESIITDLERFANSPDEYKRMGFAIESGITLKGRVIAEKGKEEKFKVTAIQRDHGDNATVDSDDDGQFLITGFQFKDSMQFLIQARNSKGKLVRNISVSRTVPPVVGDLPKATDLQVRPAQNVQHYTVRYEGFAGTMLGEVVIKAAPVNDVKPDYSMRRERLEQEKFSSLFTLMRSAVPGMNVYSTYTGDPFGVSANAYRIGFRSRNQEPLLLIDGVPQSVESIAAILNQIPASSVDHVDVFYFSVLYGVRGSGGVIAVYMKDGADAPSSSKAASLNMRDFRVEQIKGYDYPIPFKSPDYAKSDEDHSQPDFRSTIYWNPALTTNEKGEAVATFYSADLPARYRIVLEGVTPANKPFHIEKLIEVK